MPLSPPPRKNGVVEPHDHPEILDADDLIRRISNEQCVTTELGARRVSSMAFKASGGQAGGMSIDIRKSIEEAGEDSRAFVTTPKWIGSVLLKAASPRSQNLMVGFEPIPGNDHHGEIWGKFDKKVSKALQQSCQWFVELPGVALI